MSSACVVAPPPTQHARIDTSSAPRQSQLSAWSTLLAVVSSTHSLQPSNSPCPARILDDLVYARRKIRPRLVIYIACRNHTFTESHHVNQHYLMKLA
jgi:hypothetical protein